jgi:NAD(P)-dependent dehydrogenase (short-subunit alcohol dehydrogenase family)
MESFMGEILITGATGNVGEAVLNLLAAQGEPVRAAVRKSPLPEAQITGVNYVHAVAAKVLTEPGHENRTYPLTGSEAFDYYEVASILSDVLGRRIVNTNPSLPHFIWTMRRFHPLGFVLVMSALYTVGRFGLAATVTPDLAILLDRPPITMRQFVEDSRECWV